MLFRRILSQKRTQSTVKILCVLKYYFKELKLLANKPSIKIRTASLGAKSFEIEYLITSFDKENNEVIHAKGKSVQVLIDTTLGKSIEIPNWLREAIMDYEPAL